MRIKKIITGIDIGSSKVSAVTASISGEGAFAVMAHATNASRGVSRGEITDLNEAIKSVSLTLKKLKTGVPGLGDIYANIGGQSIKGSRSQGMIPLSARGREVTIQDISRCIDAASTVHLPFEREIVHKIVQKFSIDEQPWIKDPLGLYASRLSCEVYIITANVNSMQNIFKCVHGAGHDVKGIVYSGEADGCVMLDKDERKSGVLLLNIGSSLTGISVFSDGELCDIEILPCGADDFKDDFRSSASFGEVVAAARARLDKAPAIVLAGGITFADGIIEYLEETLSRPVRTGIAKDVRGEASGLDNARLYTAIGLARYSAERNKRPLTSGKNFAERFSSAVVDIFNNYF